MTKDRGTWDRTLEKNSGNGVIDLDGLQHRIPVVKDQHSEGRSM